MFEYFPKKERRFSDILLKTFKRNKDENLIIAIDSNRFIGLSKEEDAYFVKDMRSGKKNIIHKSKQPYKWKIIETLPYTLQKTAQSLPSPTHTFLVDFFHGMVTI
ncbi:MULTISPECIES: hypothetical protein [Caldicellulosiruptor]|uniref:hypothetical protein n=1 Tax=Caldicellulosiruptor TaxID=44000 RepID=UPI00039CFF13|nr:MULTISPECIES: hypothetical protein [Caldicellulosiruptor]